MASHRYTPPQPISRGSLKGLYLIRWNRYPKARENLTGYLPRPSLLADYSAYERQCWAEGVIPDAPEVHYAAEIEKMRTRQAAKHEAVVEQVAAQDRAELSISEFVGTADAPGPFFNVGRHKSYLSDSRHSTYFALVDPTSVSGRIYAPTTTIPMRAVTEELLTECLSHRIACAACVERITAAGQVPGKDVRWSRLVPVTTAVERGPDGVRCPDHRAPIKEGTLINDVHTLNALFTATTTAKARARRIQAVPSPVPEEREFERVVWNENADSELRYALSMPQVKALADASPAYLEVLPWVGVATLNRAGQEMSGLNIASLHPTNPELFSNPTSGATGGGEIAMTSFYKKTVNRLTPAQRAQLTAEGRHRRRPSEIDGGRYQMTNHAKTKRSKRRVPVPALFWPVIQRHVLEHRSTPQANCPGCQAGHGHWRTDAQASNPHVWEEDGDIRCPMAANAPLLADLNGNRLHPESYTSNIWPLVIERAGLTEDTLGFRPKPRHFRSTGTTLLLEQGVPMDVVVDLGGWKSSAMILEYYRRHRPEVLLGILNEAGGKLAMSIVEGATDEERSANAEALHAQLEGQAIAQLQARLAFTEHRLAVAERRLRSAGVPDTLDGRLTEDELRPAKSVGHYWVDDDLVASVVKHVMFDQSGSVADVVAHMGARPSGVHHKAFWAWARRRGVPRISGVDVRLLKGAKRGEFWAALAAAVGADLADYPHLGDGQTRWNDPAEIRRGLAECIVQGNGQTKTDVLRHINGPTTGAAGPKAIDNFLKALGVPGFPDRRKLHNTQRSEADAFIQRLGTALGVEPPRPDGLGARHLKAV